MTTSYHWKSLNVIKDWHVEILLLKRWQDIVIQLQLSIKYSFQTQSVNKINLLKTTWSTYSSPRISFLKYNELNKTVYVHARYGSITLRKFQLNCNYFSNLSITITVTVIMSIKIQLLQLHKSEPDIMGYRRPALVLLFHLQQNG